jgi:hypothetical protein
VLRVRPFALVHASALMPLLRTGAVSHGILYSASQSLAK